MWVLEECEKWKGKTSAWLSTTLGQHVQRMDSYNITTAELIYVKSGLQKANSTLDYEAVQT